MQDKYKYAVRYMRQNIQMEKKNRTSQNGISWKPTLHSTWETMFTFRLENMENGRQWKEASWDNIQF